MRHRKIMTLLLALMFVITSLVGCQTEQPDPSSPPPSSPSAPQTSAPASPTTTSAPPSNESPSVDTPDPVPVEIAPTKIYWWTAWAVENAMGNIIAKFNEIYPQIEVEVVQFSNNTDGNIKLDTTLLSGQGVDVIFNFGVSRVDVRAKNNLLLDLTPFIDRDRFDVVGELGENIYQMNGKYYSLPATNNAYFIWLNKSMLDAAGLKTPDKWTMDEYYNYAAKLTSGSGDSKIYGSDTLRPISQWIYMATNTFAKDPWYDANGLCNLDHPYFKRALEQRYKAENIDFIQYPYTEYMSTKLTSAATFMTGQAAMIMYGNSLWRDIVDLNKYPHDFVAECAPLPTIEATDTSYNVGGYYGYLGISAQTASPDASWAFLQFLVTEGSEGFVPVGHIPTWKKADTESIVTTIFGENPEQFVNVEQFKRVVLKSALQQQNLTDFTAYEKMTAIVEAEFESYIFDLQDLDTTISKVKTQSDAAIKDSR